MNYKTKYEVYGLPLIHIRSGKLADGRYKRGIAKGWVAEGGLAIANHANDMIARDYIENSRFFSVARLISEHSRWFLILVAIPIFKILIRRMKHCREKLNT